MFSIHVFFLCLFSLLYFKIMYFEFGRLEAAQSEIEQMDQLVCLAERTAINILFLVGLSCSM